MTGKSLKSMVFEELHAERAHVQAQVRELNERGKAIHQAMLGFSPIKVGDHLVSPKIATRPNEDCIVAGVFLTSKGFEENDLEWAIVARRLREDGEPRAHPDVHWTIPVSERKSAPRPRKARP